MTIAVFTPSHQPRYLSECYESLSAQRYDTFEWVVALNGQASPWRPPRPDSRVKVVRAPSRLAGVGALKRFACEQTDADILVELDHDDRLTVDALAEIATAFDAHPDAALIYSDFAQMNADGSPNVDRFDEDGGWRYSEEVVDGRPYLRCHALASSPHNLAYIWYAPNHVRAFRRSLYEKVGGYDAGLKVLDDQDLMMRLFEVGDFVHIDRLLYLQRVHGRNTQAAPKVNAQIQRETVAQYDASIRRLAVAWAVRAGLAQVRLFVAGDEPEVGPLESAVRLDPHEPALGFADGSVGAVKLIDVLQHVTDRAALFNECHRVLAHGGIVFTQTPSTDGRGAFQDPTHVSFWNENSFWYLTQSQLVQRSLPALGARLQVSRLHTGYPTAWHEEHHIPYVYANLLAVKDGPRQGGQLAS